MNSAPLCCPQTAHQFHFISKIHTLIQGTQSSSIHLKANSSCHKFDHARQPLTVPTSKTTSSSSFQPLETKTAVPKTKTTAASNGFPALLSSNFQPLVPASSPAKIPQRPAA
ncbi:unnamed protein product [Cuscuta campestris]|uniref:Uncharacterized protein n=1 Tax=Cuscuta campestris TaxID=132261 RepID=A0A484LAZ4_9ASTE|nr:unnamed protein product [Cuscuta campestris]